MNSHGGFRKDGDCIQPFGTGAEWVSGRGAQWKNRGRGQQVRVVTRRGYCLKKGREVAHWWSAIGVSNSLTRAQKEGPTSSPTLLPAIAQQEGSVRPLVWGVGVTHWDDGELHEETG